MQSNVYPENATRGGVVSTDTSPPLGATSRGSAAWRAAKQAAMAALADAEARREVERAHLFEDVATRVLHAARAAIACEEDLYVLAYQTLRRSGRTLWTADCHRLREATRRAWHTFDPGEAQEEAQEEARGDESSDGIEEAATATPALGTGAASPGGSTVVVSDAADGTARSSSPAGDGPRSPRGPDGAIDYFAIGIALTRAQQRTLDGEVAR